MILITGMNLAGSKSDVKAAENVSKGKIEAEGQKLNRNERIEKEKRQAYMKSRSEPYNRTFGPSVDITDSNAIGRMERRKYRKQARLQSGFMSWTIGLFTGLILILLMGAFFKESDVGANWQASNANTMITVDTNSAIETESTDSETLELKPEVDGSDENIDEDAENVEDAEITIGGEPVGEVDQQGGQ